VNARVHFKPIPSFFQTQKPLQAQAVHPTARPGIPRPAALPGERRGTVNVRRNHIWLYPVTDSFFRGVGVQDWVEELE
jgi:hypothetical protein